LWHKGLYKMKKPNLLLLLSDQHRPDFLSVNSDIPVRTPNIANLADQGVNFPKAICPSPMCGPSRACLASGKSYHRAGVPTNRVNYPLDQPTFYKILRDSGYHVAGVGKFDLHKPEFTWGREGDYLLHEWGLSEGVDSEGKIDAIRAATDAFPIGYLEYFSGRDDEIGEYVRKMLADYAYKDDYPEPTPAGPYLAYLESKGLLDVHIKDFWHRSPYTSTDPTPLPDEAYCDTWIADQGLSLLENFEEGNSWFLQVNFAGPHDPLDVTEEMYQRWQEVDFPLPVETGEFSPAVHNQIRRNYAAMIENIDMQVGRFLKVLEERGELDNTIIVYSSDHGEMLGDNNLWMKGLPLQPSVGIPLVVSGPNILKQTKSDALVSLHDLAATFLEYAGENIPEDMDSVSLKPVLEGADTHHRKLVRSAFDSWDLVYDGRYKLVKYKDERELLFDLEEDPNETENLKEQKPETYSRLKDELIKY